MVVEVETSIGHIVIARVEVTLKVIVEMVEVIFEIAEVIADFGYPLAVMDQTRNIIVILVD